MVARNSASTSGGGAATAGGTSFQEEAAAYFATLILAESAANAPTGLPADVYVAALTAEAARSVDDLMVTTSVDGRLFIQAKTSLSVSDAEDSELAKVVTQFVEQHHAGCTIGGDQCRALDPNLDRLVLVVSGEAPSTIRDTLRGMLDKLRTISTVEQLADLQQTFNASESRTLTAVHSHVQRAWLNTTGAAQTIEHELALLKLIFVLPLDLRADGSEHNRAQDLLKQVVLSDAARSGDAWNALVTAAQRWGADRTGADLESLRNLLRSLPLKSVYSYAPDIENLRRYSETRIHRLVDLASLRIDGSSIKIIRPVVAALTEFAQHGDVAVVGEPGAGKSGCLSDFVAALRASGTDVVVLAADLADASTPEALARDLGLRLGRGLENVLHAWSGSGTAYLVIDALDAARARVNLQALCSVLMAVRRSAPRWRVVASIREFDLKMASDVQEFFRGQPHPTQSDSSFASLRHIRVSRLTDEELTQVAVADGRVRAVLDACSSGLRELLRNPFNLSLLCSLIELRVSEGELNAVRAQVGLLDLYWRYRAEVGVDRVSRVLFLQALVDHLVTIRELRADKLGVITRAGAAAPALDALLTDGVLVEVDPFGSSASTLAFSHNILFDYAVALLWSGGIATTTIDALSSAEGRDLLVALRPSIVFAFERLWDTSSDRAHFWERALAVQTSAMRRIGKIIAPGVAAEHFRVVADADPLLVRIAAGDAAAIELLQSFVTAALIRHESAPDKNAIGGPSAPEWLPLAASLIPHISVAGWAIRQLLWPIARGTVQLTPAQLRAAHSAALALVNESLTDPRHAPRVRIGLEAAVKTMSANPADTEIAVRRILAPDLVAAHGHDWLDPLAENIDAMAAATPELAVDLVEVLFNVRASRDEQVPLGGRLLPMTFNRYDLLKMAQRRVAESFTAIMQRDALTATRIMLKVIESECRESERTAAEDTRTIEFRGKTIPFRPDAAHYWHEGTHSQHEEWWQILESFQSTLTGLSRSGSTATLIAVLDLLRDLPPPPIVWARVLRCLADAPEALAPVAGGLLANPAILTGHETEKAARRAIQAAYASLTRDQRRNLERATLQLAADSDDDYRPYAERTRDRCIACIPPALIEFDEVREIRNQLEDRKTRDPDDIDEGTRNDIERVLQTRRRGDEANLAGSAKQVMELANALQELQQPTPGTPLTADDAAKYLPTITSLADELARSASTEIDEKVVLRCLTQLTDACSHLAYARGLTQADPTFLRVREILLKSAEHVQPRPHPEDDERWNKSVSAYSPAPRIEAVAGLMRIAADPEIVDEDVLTAIQRLSRDPVPAVRHLVLSRVSWLSNTAPYLLDTIVEHAAERENLISLLIALAAQVAFHTPRDASGRRELAVIKIYERKRSDPDAREIREVAANHFLQRAIYDDDEAANRRVSQYAERPCELPDEVGRLIHLSRRFFRFSDSKRAPEENARIRTWMFGFLAKVVRALKRDLDVLKAKYPVSEGKQWDDEDVRVGGTVYRLAHDVATALRFGCEATNENAGTDDDDEQTTPMALNKPLFLSEAAPLLEALCDIECVEAAFDTLHALEWFIDTSPKRVLLYTAALIRSASEDNLHHESMAADVAVRIVARYLSEYAELLRSDAECREALLTVLDTFVAVGWPRALRLTHRLVDIFR